jgi:very-short-patch-repair endonuclease
MAHQATAAIIQLRYRIAATFDPDPVLNFRNQLHRRGQAMVFHTRAMIAQLHLGPSAFLDGTTAGALHRLRSMPQSLIQATVVGRVTRATPSWMRASRVAKVLDGDVVAVDEFRVAHARRALLVLAGQFNLHRFERAAEDAWHRGLVSPPEMATYLEAVRRPGLAGVATVDCWLATALDRTRPSQSGLELDALEAIRLARVPEPRRQHPLLLLSGELIHLDFAWPEVRLAVEPGHTWWHGGNMRMSADQARDRACGEVGWQVMRFDEAMRGDVVASGQQIKNTYERRRASET